MEGRARSQLAPHEVLLALLDQPLVGRGLTQPVPLQQVEDLVQLALGRLG